MFDIGFSELFVIAIVALLVLGPERLPKAARFTGLWVRRARAQWYSVKSELEDELADDELKRSLQQARDQLQGEMRDLRDGLQHRAQSVQDEFTLPGSAPAPVANAVPPSPADEHAPGASGSGVAAAGGDRPDGSLPVENHPADTTSNPGVPGEGRNVDTAVDGAHPASRHGGAHDDQR